ncbi:MAG: ABC transporter permease subunit [Candidatus Heimdallarchaeota archaeon]|nr:ABC transporter permease subunit [Candidatus Heimdallarchaeota archaeon]MCK4877633.1 ABC transporter permease subunit [Candidatus Heimdallarchaeota archaeon]
MRMLEADSMRKMNRKTVFFCLTLLIIFLSLNFFQGNNFNTTLVSAQQEKAEVVEIQDRSIILNWTIPSIHNFNSFRISLLSNQSKEESTWTMILFNNSIEVSITSFSLANFSSDGIVKSAQKIHTANFTSYVVETTAESVQTKITGLQPSTNYTFFLYLSNSSLVVEEENQVIYLLTEELYWNSTIIKTQLSSEDAIEYSRRATILTLLFIVVIFVVIFYFFAKKDVPFNRIAYIFIFPALFALVLLEIYPIIYGVILSFTSYNLRRGEIPKFNWFQNYANVAENPQLPIVFTTTLVWTTLIIIAKILLGFFIAYLIHFKVKRKKLWYLFLYLPWAIPSYIKILSWRTFIQGNAGDSFFNMLFGTNVNLGSQPYITLIIACFVEVWDSIPLITTLFLGGMSSIPRELNELAEIDQIGEGTSIRKIVVPLIKPIILPAIILEIIKTFGSFNVAFFLTKGYPILSYGVSDAGIIGATDLFSTFTFYMFYQKREIGIAAAYSTIMSLLTLFFVLLWIKMSRGTQSTYQPSKKKLPKRSKNFLPILGLFQALGYILAGITGFRYFGIHYNIHLNYIIGSLYFIASILLFFYSENIYNWFKLLIIIDLIISVSQFFVFQMWFAFNWNIFIVFFELFILSGIKKKSACDTKKNFLLRIKEEIQSFRYKIKNSLQNIDRHLIDLHSLHLVFTLQTLILLLLNIILKNKNWIMWSIFAIFLVGLVVSFFSNIMLKTSIVLQIPLLLGLVFSSSPIGWMIGFIILSTVFAFNYAKVGLVQTSLLSKKSFGNRILRLISRPKNSSMVLLVVIIIAFIPIWNIAWIAFATGNQIVPTSFIPKNPTLDNFRLLFTEEDIYLNFGNSLLVALGSAGICVFITTLAGYSFSRYNFKAKKEMMVGVFVLKIFTGILTLIPFYLIMFNLGLIDTYIGVILAYSTHTIPIALWIIKGYIDSIPKELDEASQIMGNTSLRTIRKIILPLSGPALAITFLLNFLAAWNGFLLAYVLLQSSSKYTLPVKLFTFIESIEGGDPQWGLFAAASILVIIPLLIIFIFLRNYILKGFDSSTEMGDV